MKFLDRPSVAMACGLIVGFVFGFFAHQKYVFYTMSRANERAGGLSRTVHVDKSIKELEEETSGLKERAGKRQVEQIAAMRKRLDELEQQIEKSEVGK